MIKTMYDYSVHMELNRQEIKALKAKVAELEQSRKDLIEEFAEAECMGDLAKIARNHGYEEKGDE